MAHLLRSKYHLFVSASIQQKQPLVILLPPASLDSRHLRDVPFPATGTQGYQLIYPIPSRLYAIAQPPPVKAMPLARWLLVAFLLLVAPANLGISAVRLLSFFAYRLAYVQ